MNSTIPTWMKQEWIQDSNKNEKEWKRFYFMTLYVKYMNENSDMIKTKENQKNTLHFLVYFSAHNFYKAKLSKPTSLLQKYNIF